MNASKHFFALFIGLTAISARAADWPCFRGPDQDGISKETGLNAKAIENGAKIVWQAGVGTGFASISIADGRAYTMGNDSAKDTVWCFDADTGKELWKHSYAEELKDNLYEGGPNATPTVAGGHVYTLSKTGRAFCFDAAKGTVVWEKNLAEVTGATKPQWGFASSPFIEGDLVIYNVGAAGTALNRKTGALAWKSGTDVSGYSSAVAFTQGKDRLAIMMTAREAVAFDPANGQVAWRHPWKTQYDINAADPVVSGNKFFVSSGYNHGASVFEVKDNQTAVLWENKSLRNHFSSSVLWKGHLYGVDESQLRCVDFASGEVKWTDKATGKGSLLIADGKLVALSDKGELIIAEAASDAFKPVARAKILSGKCWTPPALANGRIYARNAKVDLVCVDVGGK